MIKAENDLMENILENGIPPDLVMFNALIDGHCANGKIKECAFAFKRDGDYEG